MFHGPRNEKIHGTSDAELLDGSERALRTALPGGESATVDVEVRLRVAGGRLTRVEIKDTE